LAEQGLTRFRSSSFVQSPRRVNPRAQNLLGYPSLPAN
jgi:hypothetical protein